MLNLHPNFINLIIGWYCGLTLFTILFWMIKYKQGKKEDED